MKKICIITTVHSRLDTRIFYHEAFSLAKRYEIELIAPSEKDLNQEGIKIKSLGVSGGKAERILKNYFSLKYALLSKADVYHFHDVELIPVGIILKIITRKPVIYDIHENNPEYMLDKEWIPTGLIRMLVSVAVRGAETLAAKFLDGVVVVNSQLFTRFKKLNVNTEIIMNFPNQNFGADFTSLGFDKRNKVALFIGGIEEERGVMRILELVKKNKKFYLKFLFIGTVKGEKLRKKIDAFIEKESISKKQFEIIPHISHREITKFLNESFAGIIPFLKTRNNYLGTPQKTFEYMAYGLPIISSDFLFLREFIGKSKSGVLVQDVEDLDKLKYDFDTLNNKKIWSKLSSNGRKAFLERYNWEKQEEKLFAFYERVLKDK